MVSVEIHSVVLGFRLLVKPVDSSINQSANGTVGHPAGSTLVPCRDFQFVEIQTIKIAIFGKVCDYNDGNS